MTIYASTEEEVVSAQEEAVRAVGCPERWHEWKDDRRVRELLELRMAVLKAGKARAEMEMARCNLLAAQFDVRLAGLTGSGCTRSGHSRSGVGA